MFIYFFLLFIFVFVYITEKKNDAKYHLFIKQNNQLILFLLFLLLCIVSAIRYNVGTDYSTYVKMYYDQGITTNEIGFMALLNISRNLNLGPQFIISLFSFLTIFFSYLYIRENSSNPYLSLLIFYLFTPFYFQTLNVVRQELAIYLFMYSIKYIRSNNFGRYATLILIGSLFCHLSLLICLPLYFIKFINLNKKSLIIVIISLVILSPVLIQLLKIAPYGYYFDFIGESKWNISVSFLLGLFLAISSLFICIDIINKDIFLKINYILLCVMSLCVVNLYNNLPILIERIMWYFYPSIIITIPEALYYLKDKKNVIENLVLISLIVFFVSSIVLRGEANELVPYGFFFGKFD